MGQGAIAQGALVVLPPHGGIAIDSACSGFTWAIITGATGLVLATGHRQGWLRTALIILGGVALALLLNVVRLVIMTLATVYWGEAVFEFWHGPWGGQILSGLLLTVYYYDGDRWQGGDLEAPGQP